MRIAIVNDMLMATESLRRVILSKPGHQVAWVARDGSEAVQKCRSDKPDLILMDMVMPGLNGVEATRQIMRDSACAILVVTATVEGNIGLVFDAMSSGALDAVNTPVLGASGDLVGADELMRKIEIIGRLIGKVGRQPLSGASISCHGQVATNSNPLVVIGASTGGPAALAKILSGLPPTFHSACVVVQHVDREFSPGLASWLSGRSAIEVKVASKGARPAPGVIWLAGTNDHMVLTPGLALDYERQPVECFYRPSVDVFFRTVAAHWPSPGVAVLLTGMGRDGGEGLLALRRVGWCTIAQDEQTSVVYGMPRAAAELGAAQRILPLGEISAAIAADLETMALRRQNG